MQMLFCYSAVHLGSCRLSCSGTDTISCMAGLRSMTGYCFLHACTKLVCFGCFNLLSGCLNLRTVLHSNCSGSVTTFSSAMTARNITDSSY